MIDGMVVKSLTEMTEPVVIPIESDSECAVPTWAMLELNGELIVPQEINKENQASQLILPGQMELGSLRFEGEVRIV